MPTTRVTSKGQVTILKEVRERMGLRPGDELEFTEDDGVFRLSKRLPPNPFKKWRGYLEHLRGQDPDELVRQMRGH